MSNKVKIVVEDLGDIIVELYPEKAPVTVENFLTLVREGFYSGLIFHRVISGFMVQGGGMDSRFNGKAAKSIRGEFASNGFAQNDISHERGVISMARTSDPDSASSQFFIMHADGKFLDGQYAAFGKVTEGMDVVDKIAAVQTGEFLYYNDVPVSPVIIKEITETD